MKYEYLPHTADIKFRAFGKNIDDVFKNCALAMFNILGDTSKVKTEKIKKIKVKTNSIESLLYDFLEKLLILIDTEGFFLHNVKELKIDKKKLELTAIIDGDDIKKYQLSGDIKAITYHDMSIKLTKYGYEAIVVVDI